MIYRILTVLGQLPPRKIAPLPSLNLILSLTQTLTLTGGNCPDTNSHTAEKIISVYYLFDNICLQIFERRQKKTWLPVSTFIIIHYIF